MNGKKDWNEGVSGLVSHFWSTIIGMGLVIWFMHSHYPGSYDGGAQKGAVGQALEYSLIGFILYGWFNMWYQYGKIVFEECGKCFDMKMFKFIIIGPAIALFILHFAGSVYLDGHKILVWTVASIITISLSAMMGFEGARMVERERKRRIEMGNREASE